MAGRAAEFAEEELSRLENIQGMFLLESREVWGCREEEGLE